jgi:hypothetical protein
VSFSKLFWFCTIFVFGAGDFIMKPEEKGPQDSITAHLTGAVNHPAFDAKESFSSLRAMLARVTSNS